VGAHDRLSIPYTRAPLKIFSFGVPMICSSFLDSSQGNEGILPPSSVRMNRLGSSLPLSAAGEKSAARSWNRLRQVREQQGLTLRTVSRRTGISIRQLRLEEEPDADLSISVLERWRGALEVPLSELMVEPDEALSPIVSQRAKLLRVMKTALSLQEGARDPQQKRLAEMLCLQLQELMPELAQQTPWPTVGSRRSQDDLGRIAQQPVRIEFDEPLD